MRIVCISRRSVAVALAVLAIGSGFCASARGQENAPKPKVSDEPLTAEQLAVYRGFFKAWFTDGPGQANLSALTEPIHEDELGYDKKCAAFDDAEAAPAEIHRFRADDLSQLGPLKLRLLDPDKGRAEVKENDPENGMRSGKSVDDAVENGFRHGLFSLSEIRFNKQHTRAVVTYGFVCGGLCGNGGTMVMEKLSGGEWKRVRSCGGWIS